MTKAGQLDQNAVLTAKNAERLHLADFLDTLDETDWQTGSLCTGWTVRDVVAHLTLATRQSVGATMLRVIRARGDFNRVNNEWARERAAAFSPAELVGQLRESANSARRFAFSGVLDPLIDLMVHGQDIARPLGRTREMPVDWVVPALEHVWPASFYGARKRFDGLKFVATDADWTAGEGQQVHGPAADLLLLAPGRAAGLSAVKGPGAAEAAARLS
jgi:uncharacterized protein (TIGR03083 family)